jgi:hypothetical protein
MPHKARLGDAAIRMLPALRAVAMVRAVVVLVGLPAWLPRAGCQTLGPAALGAARRAYNDVIGRTSSEQTLGVSARLRYSDPIALLAVSSVTAGLRFSAEAISRPKTRAAIVAINPVPNFTRSFESVFRYCSGRTARRNIPSSAPPRRGYFNPYQLI